MTVREAVSQIRTMNKWISSDDLITDRAVASEIKSVSQLLIKQQTDKRKLMASNSIFTQIDCVEMEAAQLAECCSYTSPCQIGKSKQKIPKIGDNIYGLLIQGVYSIDKRVKFDYIDPNRYANFLNLYPKSDKKFFWVRNDHLYITDPDIEIVALSAFFEDDVDTSLYNCDCDGQDCPPNPLDKEFKCPGFLINNVFTITRDNLTRSYRNSVEDKTENNLSEAK